MPSHLPEHLIGIHSWVMRFYGVDACEKKV